MRDLLVGASILALGFAAASDASAGSRNNFSPGATSSSGVTVGSSNGNVTIESGNVSTDITAVDVQTAGFVTGTITMNASAAALGGGINNASIVLGDDVLQGATGNFALNFNTAQFVNQNAANAIATNFGTIDFQSN